MENAIEIKQLKKHFVQRQKGIKKVVEAVCGVSLAVKSGEIFGFLGPNGAGKTTTLRMLTTLLPMDEGEVLVAGFDLKKQPHEVRRRIGFVSQLGGADLNATGWENLLLEAQLYGMSREEARRRSEELLQLFDLKELADRKVKTYSGGQKRRLEVALGIIHQPEVLFLDEPTTGLDPQNRANLWSQIRQLRDNGTTIFLTTHYLDEADMLADRLAIMDHGRIIAEGSPRELKQQIAGDVIAIEPKQSSDIDEMRQHFAAQPYVREVNVQDESLYLYVEDGTKAMPTLFAFLEANGLELERISLSQPSLDDVFLKQTGRSLRDTGAKEGA